MGTIAELAERLPEHERAHAMELAEDILFMRGKLAESRRGLADQQIVVPYDNGGGQEGIRRNPAFDAYEALLKSYTAAMNELRGLLAKQSATAEPAKPTARLVRFNQSSKFAKAADG